MAFSIEINRQRLVRIHYLHIRACDNDLKMTKPSGPMLGINVNVILPDSGFGEYAVQPFPCSSRLLLLLCSLESCVKLGQGGLKKRKEIRSRKQDQPPCFRRYRCRSSPSLADCTTLLTRLKVYVHSPMYSEKHLIYFLLTRRYC